MNITTVTGHIVEISVLASFLLIMAIPVLLEVRKNKNAPKPTGATRVQGE